MAPDVEQRELCETVRQQIMELEEGPREALLLRYFSGRSIRDIAMLLDLTPNAAKKRLQRAREILGKNIVRELTQVRATEEVPDQKVKRIMAIVGAMPVPWRESIGTAAPAAAIGGGLLTAKSVVGVIAALCVLSAFFLTPARFFFRDDASPSQAGPGLYQTTPSEAADRRFPYDQAMSRIDSPDVNNNTADNTDGMEVSTAAALAAVAGIVVDETAKQPVQDATVVVMASDGAARQNVNVDKYGRFQITGLPDGKYQAVAKGDYVVSDDPPLEFCVADGESPEELVINVGVGAVVEGRIFDAETGSALAGVEMEASRGCGQDTVVGRAKTDASGFYRVTGLPPEQLRILCGKAAGYPERRPGYGQEFRQVLVKPQQTLKDVDFGLRAGIAVSGKVMDKDGRPIAGAEILARGKDAGATCFTVAEADGRFCVRGLNATPELYVLARKDGRTQAPTGPFALDARGLEALVLVLTPEAFLEGQVIDQWNNPVPEVKVTAYPVNPFPFQEPRGTSGPDGRFTIAGLWPGSFDVRIAPPSATQPEGGARRVTIPYSGSLGGLILRCETGALTISGLVTNLDHEPLTGVGVSAVGSFDGQTITRSADTNENGRYVIDGLPAGSYEVHIFDPRYVEARQWDVAAGSENIDFVLGPSPTICGRVLHADTGEPFTSFEVLVHPGLAMAVSPWMESEFIQIQDEEGRFTFEHVPGGFGFAMVAARAPGYAAKVVQVVGIAPGRRIEDVTLRLEPAVQVDGVVVNTEGRSIEGALVFIGGMPETSTPETGASARTDPSGRFHLDTVAPNVRIVTAHHPSYAPGSTPLSAVGGTSQTVRIVLTAKASVEGVVTAEGAPAAEQWVHLRYSTEGPVKTLQAVTNAEGFYRFADLPPGEAVVSVSHWIEVQGRKIERELSRTVALGARSVATVNLDLQEGTASVKGTVSFGEWPATTGEVAIHIHTPSGDFSRSAEIQANGGYAMAGLPAGTGELVVQAGLGEEQPMRTRTLSVNLFEEETTVHDVVFGKGATVHIGITGDTAAIAVVPGEWQFPSGQTFDEYADIERALVWQGECRAGEIVEVAGLESGVYTIFALADPLGERRIDGLVITLREDEVQQVTLQPR